MALVQHVARLELSSLKTSEIKQVDSTGSPLDLYLGGVGFECISEHFHGLFL
jgi:hypothetical protein